MSLKFGSHRGIALVTTLCVSTVLLVLGIAFLTFLERDYRFAATQSRNQEAYYLALCGIEYAKARGDLVAPSKPLVQRSIPSSNPSRYFQVQLLGDGTLRSTGVVQSGLIKVSKTLQVRPGESPRQYVETGI
jgi:type II secretory pathway component PulK